MFAAEQPVALRIRLVIAASIPNLQDAFEDLRDEDRDAAYRSIFDQIDLPAIIKAADQAQAGDTEWTLDRNDSWHGSASASGQSMTEKTKSDSNLYSSPSVPLWAVFAQLASSGQGQSSLTDVVELNIVLTLWSDDSQTALDWSLHRLLGLVSAMMFSAGRAMVQLANCRI